MKTVVFTGFYGILVKTVVFTGFTGFEDLPVPERGLLPELEVLSGN